MNSISCDDDRLLIAAAQRDRIRFAELYERNFDRVYAFIARRVSSREAAEDLTAEVFHQALASIGGFHWQGAPFIAWLYGIAANVLSAYWRGVGKGPDQLQERWEESGSEEVERRTMLAELVDSLSPDQRTVIVRRFVEGRSIKEIAQQIGRSEGAVKQLQLRALEHLRERYGRRHE